MKKLTLEYLEQIVPYLPYELQMKAIEGTMIYTAKGINICSENWILIKDKNGFDCQIKNIKPILHPSSEFQNTTTKDLMKKFNCSFDVICDAWEFYQEMIKIENIKYSTYLMFCRNHIDFNNLIEKGLAIDINTLTK